MRENEQALRPEGHPPPAPLHQGQSTTGKSAWPAAGPITPVAAIALQRTVGNRGLTQLLQGGSAPTPTSVQTKLTKVERPVPSPKGIEEDLRRVNDEIVRYNARPSVEALTAVVTAFLDLLDHFPGPAPIPQEFLFLRQEIRLEAAQLLGHRDEPQGGQSNPQGGQSEPLHAWQQASRELGPPPGNRPGLGSRSRAPKEAPKEPKRRELRARHGRTGQARDTFSQLLMWKEAGVAPSAGDLDFFKLVFNNPAVMAAPAHGLDGAIYDLYSHGGGGPTQQILPLQQLVPLCQAFWGALHGLGFYLQYEGPFVDALDAAQLTTKALRRFGGDFCYRTVNAQTGDSVRVYINVDQKPLVIRGCAQALLGRGDIIKDFKFAGPLSGGRSDGLVVWCPSENAAAEVNRLVLQVHSDKGGTIGASRPAMTGSIGTSGGVGLGSEPLAHGLATGQRSTPLQGYSDEAQSFGTIRSEVLKEAVLLFRGSKPFAAALELSHEELFYLIAAGLFNEAGITGGASGKAFDRRDK